MSTPWWAWLAIGVAVMESRPPELGVVPAHLAAGRKLRQRPSTARIVYHTTGRNLPKAVRDRTNLEPGSRAFDDAVVRWYQSSGMPYFGAYLVGTSGVIFELATPGTWCQHAASLTAEEVASTPPSWWRDRWPQLRHPTDLLQGSPHINVSSLGVDLVPHPDGQLPDLHTPATLAAAARLGRHLAAAYGLTLEARHHVGHEDVDPWSRSTNNRPWDPGWRREHFLKDLEVSDGRRS